MEGDHSLGSILAANSITESLVKNNCNTHKRMSHLPDNSRHYRTLFRYEITENRYEDTQFFITGHHVTVNPISDSLCKRLLENGMPQERINLLKKGG